MSLLPTSGTISYNGYTFNAATETRIVGRPVYDRADRTITHVVYTISLRSFVPESAPGVGADTVIADLRQRLQSPGRDLTYTGQGFGDLTINTGNVKDVLWGPRPTLLALRPLGSKALWEINWQCEVAIPECSAAQYMNAVMAFNYEIITRIDSDGYTTRTFTGYLEIPVTRAGGGRTVPDSADEYRERIILTIPDGFKREAQDFTLSADRRRLDWTIVDQQQPTEGLVLGCTDAIGSHSVRPQTEGLATWIGTLSATYTVAPNRPRRDAYEAFFALWDDRRRAAEANAPRQLSTVADATPNVRIVSLEIDQGLYRSSRTVSFSLSYFFTCSLDSLLLASGIWRPVPNTDGQLWAATIGDVASVRGSAGLRNDASGEIIIDLCGSQSTQLRSDSLPGGALETEGSTSLQTGGFIDYRNVIDIEERPGWSTLKALPKQATAELTSGLARGASLSTGNNSPTSAPTEQFAAAGQVDAGAVATPRTIYYLVPFGGYYGDVVKAFQAMRLNLGQRSNVRVTPGNAGGDVPQARVVSSYTIRIRGYAVSAGIPIECPVIQQFEDAELIPEPTEKARFSTWIAGYLLGQPIHCAEWFIPYRAIYPNGARAA